jgi:hypothetical protein
MRRLSRPVRQQLAAGDEGTSRRLAGVEDLSVIERFGFTKDEMWLRPAARPWCHDRPQNPVSDSGVAPRTPPVSDGCHLAEEPAATPPTLPSARCSLFSASISTTGGGRGIPQGFARCWIAPARRGQEHVGAFVALMLFGFALAGASILEKLRIKGP